jgi:cytochrome c-type biogenesis protein CcmH/NrfF
MECYLIPICLVLLGTSFVEDPERRRHSLGAREKEEEREKKRRRRKRNK